MKLPTELVEESRRIVEEAMGTVPAGFTMSLKVEVKTGGTWAECEDGPGNFL